MSKESFLGAPWTHEHPHYSASLLAMQPAPENATAEVLLASTYRASGFPSHGEGKVTAAGRALEMGASSGRAGKQLAASGETWRAILQGVLQSPKQPKQSTKRFLQLCPLVPDTALYSGAARLVDNPWNPGQLVARMTLLGSPDATTAREMWEALHQGLGVSDSDDVWARWLQAEFEARCPIEASWQPAPIATNVDSRDLGRVFEASPARRFVRDLRAVLDVKHAMTRRQWISVLEALLRLAAVTHVLWTCEVQARLWQALLAAVDGAEAPEAEAVEKKVFGGPGRLLVYGDPALLLIREVVSRGLHARLGLNLLLWTCEHHGIGLPTLRSASGLHDLMVTVREQGGRLDGASLRQELGALTDSHASVLACKKTIGQNLYEFCRYVLGQRQTLDQTLRGYDQGYLLRQRADYVTAPWVVAFGPVALLTVTHCCLAEVAGPRSVRRLCDHLAEYGVEIDRDDLAASDLGRLLRLLGLVLDSPDAESGMLLVPPFERSVRGG